MDKGLISYSHFLKFLKCNEIWIHSSNCHKPKFRINHAYFKMLEALNNFRLLLGVVKNKNSPKKFETFFVDLVYLKNQIKKILHLGTIISSRQKLDYPQNSPLINLHLLWNLFHYSCIFKIFQIIVTQMFSVFCHHQNPCCSNHVHRNPVSYSPNLQKNKIKVYFRVK